MSCIYRSLKSEEATRLLKEQGVDGSYMIALSSNPPDLTMLCRIGNEIKKVRIKNNGDHYEMYGSEEFATLPELIEFYSKDVGRMTDKKNGVEIVLKHPFIISKLKKERWFHGSVNTKDAERRLKKEQPGSFLIRISSNGPYVISCTDEQQRVIHVKIAEYHSQYTIGEGHYFDSLPDLVEFYKKNKINIHDEISVQTSSEYSCIKKPTTKTIILIYEAKAGRIMLSMLKERIEELSVVEKETDLSGFESEFQDLLEIDELDSSTDPKKKLHLGEREKNRYKNILPYETTRVKLTETDPRKVNSDYINASYVKINDILPQVNCNYIATQGCLLNTITDFWLMIWQNETNIIIMLTQTIEDGRNKCVQYWPEIGNSTTLEIHGNCKLKIELANVCHSSKNTFLVREFKIEKIVKKGKNEKRTVFQYHYLSWPDKDSPDDIPAILEFVSQVEERSSSIRPKSPIVVHCSAGVGRTGTYILIDAIMKLIKKNGLDIDVDIKQLVLEIRKYRSGMVQTPSQYIFIYKAIQFYIDHFFKGKNSEI